MGYIGIWNGHILDISEMENIPYGYISEIVGGATQLLPRTQEMEITDIYGIINEEGKLIPLPLTAYLVAPDGRVFDEICGPIVFVGVENGDFCPLTIRQSAILEEYLNGCPDHQGTICFVF